MVRTRSQRNHLAQLSALDEASERLDVRAIPMVVRDAHHSPGLGRGRENALHAARRQRQWTLTQYVPLCRERAQDVRLVEVIGRRDDDRVEIIELEEVLDVGEDVGNVESVGERAGLRAVVVADGRELSAAHLGEHRQVRQLGDSARSHDPNANCVCHRC